MLKITLTPAEAHRLEYVRSKLREATSAYQHDRLIDAITEVFSDAMRRLNNASESGTSCS